MTSPDNSPIFTANAVYTQDTPSGSLWGKIASGVGSILGGIAQYAGEALPYIAQATSTYGSASNTPLGTTSDNSTPLIYQPSNVSLPNVAPIPIKPVFVSPPKPQAPVRLQALQNLTQQLKAGINPVRETRINHLNALAQGTGHPTHSQYTTNAQTSSVHASQGSLLRNAGSTAPHWIQEQPYSSQGAQQPVSYASLYQAGQADSFLPFHFHSPTHVSSIGKSSSIAKHQVPLKQVDQQSHNSDVSANTAYQFLNNSYRKPERIVLHFPGIQEFKSYPRNTAKYDTDKLESWHRKVNLYPDVTKNQQIYVKFITDIVRKHRPGALQYISRFWPDGVWDLKGQSGIPPNNSLARYKGEIVTAMYLANNAFGHAMAAAGFTLKQALDYAEWASSASRFTYDQPEDQAAIISGWFEEDTGDPWPLGMPDPYFYTHLQKNYPEQYKKHEQNFQGQTSIKKLLVKADKLYKNQRIP